jgi:hypothetical protein
MKKIRVMADYDCFPLWWSEPDFVANIDPSTLPISQSLHYDLMAWAGEFTATLDRIEGRNSGFKTDAEYVDFNSKGNALTERLQTELNGEYSVYYHAQKPL